MGGKYSAATEYFVLKDDARSRRKNLSDFEEGPIWMARRLSQSSQSAVVSTYQEWSMEGMKQ